MGVDESINLNLGGNTTGYVAAARDALQSTVMLVDACAELKTVVTKQADEMDRATHSTRKHKDETKNLHGEVGVLDRSLNKALGSVKGFIGAWVGMSGIQKVLGMISDEMENMRKSTAAAAGEVKTLGQNLRDMAVQRGIEGQPDAFQKMRERVNYLRRQTGIADAATISALDRGTNVAFGDLTDEQQLQMSAMVGRFAFQKNIRGGAVSDVMGILGMTRDKDPRQVMQMLADAATKSRSEDFGAFVQNFGRLFSYEKAQGGTFQQTLSEYVGAMGIMGRGGEDLSRELVKQVSTLAGRPEIIKAIGRKDYSSLSRQEQKGLVMDYITQLSQTPEGKEAMWSLLPPEMKDRAVALYGPQGQQLIGEASGILQTSTAGKFSEQLAGSEQQQDFKNALIAVESQIAKEALGAEGATGESLRDRIISMRDAIARGETPAGMTDEQAKKLKGLYWLAGNERELSFTAQEFYRPRVETMEKAALQSGDISYTALGSEKAETSYGQMVIDLKEMLREIGPGGWANLKQQDLGKMDRMVNLLESIDNKLGNAKPEGPWHGTGGSW